MSHEYLDSLDNNPTNSSSGSAVALQSQQYPRQYNTVPSPNNLLVLSGAELAGSMAAEVLRVEFHRFVGKETNNQELVNTPDVLTANNKVNQEWVSWLVDERLVESTHKGRTVLVPKKTAGQLMYDKTSDEWIAVDDYSPIGRVASMKQKAIELIERENPASDREVMEFEAEARKTLVGIYNQHAAERFNGQRKVVKGIDFRGVNLRYIASLSLAGMRTDIQKTSAQNQHPSLFDRWDEGARHKQLRTPSQADRFLAIQHRQLNDSGLSFNVEHSPEELANLKPAARALYNLVRQNRNEYGDTYLTGLIAIANILYAGDIHKTFINFSAIANMTGQRLPEGWQQFHGTTTEARLLIREIPSLRASLDGYLEAADRFYDRDMTKTFINFSAIANMTGQRLPEGWQQFHGTTTEFWSQFDWIVNNLNAKVIDFKKVFKIKSQKSAESNYAVVRKAMQATAS